mmetsp:Transcript_70493/g.168839  ORF Transcript_70493/g.168839 Transcript_70493/m.168839 type:complete len:206 (+) Transcript_70493:773-1390(+)
MCSSHAASRASNEHSERSRTACARPCRSFKMFPSASGVEEMRAASARNEASLATLGIDAPFDMTARLSCSAMQTTNSEAELDFPNFCNSRYNPGLGLCSSLGRIVLSTQAAHSRLGECARSAARHDASWCSSRPVLPLQMSRSSKICAHVRSAWDPCQYGSCACTRRARTCSDGKSDTAQVSKPCRNPGAPAAQRAARASTWAKA